jgi:hypothetical protein
MKALDAPDLRTRRAALCLLIALPLAARSRTAETPPTEVLSALPGAQLLGSGTLRYLGLHVYDIRLWADDPRALERPESARLALELRYARSLEGSAIAERSLKEMQGIGNVSGAQAERWLATMRGIFPDVRKGDRITGLQLPGEGARFWVNGRESGELKDAEFTRLFFGIWLSPRSSQPRLREALLGGRATLS